MLFTEVDRRTFLRCLSAAALTGNLLSTNAQNPATKMASAFSPEIAIRKAHEARLANAVRTLHDEVRHIPMQ